MAKKKAAASTTKKKSTATRKPAQKKPAVLEFPPEVDDGVRSEMQAAHDRKEN